MSEDKNLQSEEEKNPISEAENKVTNPVTPAEAANSAADPTEEVEKNNASEDASYPDSPIEGDSIEDVNAEGNEGVDEDVEILEASTVKTPPDESEDVTQQVNSPEQPDQKANETATSSVENSHQNDAEKVSEEAEVENQDNEPISKDTLEVEDEIEEEPSHDEDEVLPDYTLYSREQLVVAVEELTQQDTFKRSSKIIEIIEPLFKTMEDEKRNVALTKYIEEGGEEDSFEFRHDELFNRFDASQRLIRDRRAAFHKEKEAAKERNLAKKEELLEQLRELVDGENASTDIKPIKEIQEAWKAVGPVPNQHNRTLWANYNALLDRFYNNRHILFELKELDRKKNYAAKLELCEKAETLDKTENIKDAIIQLNELHEEYKKIGAVPREVQEELWQRFKSASDIIYKKRKEYLDSLKGELKENLVLKEKLIEELKSFTNFDSDRINDWNAKTKEILAVQKKWDAIGGVPREKAKEINKGFWSNFKKFFSNKNEFFKKLEGLRKVNLEKKEELVKQAEAFAESQDWESTAEKIKALQREWKSIGPVPEKQRNLIYAQFKEACDTFFNNKRSNANQAEAEFLENQKGKEAIIEKLIQLAGGNETSEEELLATASEYHSFGFVPRNSMKTLEQKFANALETYVATLGLDDSDAETLMIKAEMAGGGKSGASDKKLQKKESTLRRKINELEDNIALLNNNLAFFANSKTADKLKGEFDQKIETAEEELRKLKKQLRILRNL